MKKILLISFVLFFGKIYSQKVKYSTNGNKCINSSIEFINESTELSDSCSWDFGDGNMVTTTKKSTFHVYDTAGTYPFKFTIFSSGIEKYAITPKDFIIYDNPVADFTYDTVALSSSTKIFASTNKIKGASYHWDFGDGSAPVVIDNHTTKYKFKKEGELTIWHKVQSPAGCIDSISKTITISDIFNVPNVFTPNGDGINDLFMVSTNGINNFVIDIFGRWGNLVFKRSGHKQIVWDGRMPDGSLVTPGTYFYVIQPTDSEKIFEPEKGYITVLY